MIKEWFNELVEGFKEDPILRWIFLVGLVIMPLFFLAFCAIISYYYGERIHGN